MKVLMVCSEFAPLAKTGGLADAVSGLCAALCARGHDVRVVLPRYSHLPPAGAVTQSIRAGAYRFDELDAAALEPVRGGNPSRPRRAAPRVYLLHLAELTAEGIYAGDDRDAGRFIRLAEASAALGPALGWAPDIVHCHDWHAAMLPPLLLARLGAARPPTLLTLHNIGYQGLFAAGLLAANDFDDVAAAVAPEVLTTGSVNFLRLGIRTADVVTTVSPTYAKEILTPEFGMGLEDALAERGDEVVGILNGVDYDTWGPTTDPFINVRYDVANISPKYRLKGALSVRLGLLPDQNAPLVGIVSRLAPQKGIDLVTAVLPTLLTETRANFVILGSGDVDLATELARLAALNPRRVSFTDGYNEALAHQILAGSDIALVPSRYEPCGLTQMYALRYGTIPVVRATGGLADTIRHYDPAVARGNGSVFRDADASGLLWGIRSALGWFDDPTAWVRLVENAMADDFSWRRQVRPYEALYRSLADKRRPR